MSRSHIVVATVLSVACVADLRMRRIPSVLTFSAVAAVLVFYLLAGGMGE